MDIEYLDYLYALGNRDIMYAVGDNYIDNGRLIDFNTGEILDEDYLKNIFPYEYVLFTDID